MAGSDEIQLRIDPMQGDFDDEISGLRSQVRQLRDVSFSFLFFFFKKKTELRGSYSEAKSINHKVGNMVQYSLRFFGNHNFGCILCLC